MQCGGVRAREFLCLSDCVVVFHSQLRGMLKKDSNILHFQNLFEIFDEGEVGSDFLEWLYHTKSTDYAALPENTSLQKNVKKHLLSGGAIRNTYGRLI